MLHWEGVCLLAKLLLDEMAHFAPKSVGGLEMGAIQLATSIMLKSTCAGKSKTKFIFIRWTSSQSATDAIYAANDRGYNVKAVVVVIRLNENS